MDNQSDICISSCISETELTLVWQFLKTQLLLSQTHPRNLEFYIAKFHKSPNFLLKAKCWDKILGGCFGHINTEGELLIGEIAVDSSTRHQNIASRLLAERERNAKDQGIHKIVLGDLGSVSPFYFKHGFTANLYIQIEEPPSVDELLILNPKFPFLNKSLDDGWSRLLLYTKTIDKKLEQVYHDAYPNVSTIYIYEKQLEVKTSES